MPLPLILRLLLAGLLAGSTLLYGRDSSRPWAGLITPLPTLDSSSAFADGGDWPMFRHDRQ